MTTAYLHFICMSDMHFTTIITITESKVKNNAIAKEELRLRMKSFPVSESLTWANLSLIKKDNIIVYAATISVTITGATESPTSRIAFNSSYMLFSEKSVLTHNATDNPKGIAPS